MASTAAKDPLNFAPLSFLCSCLPVIEVLTLRGAFALLRYCNAGNNDKIMTCSTFENHGKLKHYCLSLKVLSGPVHQRLRELSSWQVDYYLTLYDTVIGLPSQGSV